MKPIVPEKPKKEPEPMPEVKDEFTDLFDLAKSSLSAKPQPEKKRTPFDEEIFPSNRTAELFAQPETQNFSDTMQNNPRVPLTGPENFRPMTSQPAHVPNTTEQGNDVNVFDLF